MINPSRDRQPMKIVLVLERKAEDEVLFLSYFVFRAR